MIGKSGDDSGYCSISMSKQVPQILLIMAFFKLFGLFFKNISTMSGNRSTSVGTDSTDASNILSFITSFCGICLPT